MSSEEHTGSTEPGSVGPPCPACGAALAPAGRFCPSCGLPLDGATSTRRVYGVLAPGPAFVLACALLLGAVMALVAGSPLVAVVLVALSAASFALFVGAAERDPASPVAHGVTTGARRVRHSVAFGRVSVGAWAIATRELATLHFRVRALRNERRRVLPVFAEATLREDSARSDELRRRLQAIDEGLGVCDRARAAALARARQRLSEERHPDLPTRELSAAELVPSDDRQQ